MGIFTSNTNSSLNFFHSLRGKLTILLLGISLLPLAIMGTLVYSHMKSGLKDSAIHELEAIRDIKADHVASFINEKLADVQAFSSNLSIINAMQEFDKAVESLMTTESIDEVSAMERYRNLYLNQPNLVNANDGSAYSVAHTKYHSMIKKYMESFGYYDVFLIEPHTGGIVYTVEKEDDFGTNLLEGKYANTHLAELFKKIVKATHADFTLFQDFEYYTPSQMPAPFAASPIFNESELIGVLVFQVSTEQINNFMRDNVGLGETAETVLVSLEDFLLRSNSRFSEETTLLKQKMDNKATRAAAMGEKGVEIITDQQGKSIFYSYQPLDIPNVKWALIAKENKEEALAMVAPIINMILIIMIIIAVVAAGVALFMAKSIVNPIIAMANTARQLAEGNIDQKIEITSKDEIGLMGNAFSDMVNNLRLVIDDVVQVSQGLAKGDLSVIPQTYYKGDFMQIRLSLETSLMNLRAVIADIVQMSQGLVKSGRAIAKTKYRGDFEQIKEALEIASAQLLEARINNEREAWLKTGLARLNELMSGEQKIDVLAKKIITFLTTYSKGKIGLFYVSKESELKDKIYLELVANYAYVTDKNMILRFQIGEGLVGQAALDKKTLVFEQDKNYSTVMRSGLGNVQPCYVLFLPLLYEGTVKGVIEIGSSEELTELQRNFLEQAMPIIGIAVNTAESRDKMQVLLEQSQQQAEELKAQSEELRTQRENL